MADYREQQIEALAMISEYVDKVIPAMEEVCAELTGEMKEDTVEYLKQIIDAFNFVIETYNVTSNLINEKETLINDDELEKSVQALSDCMIAKKYEDMAPVLSSDIIEFLKVFNIRAKELVG